MPEAKKDKTGKLPIDLIPIESIEGLARVFEFGSTKYEKHNWKNGRSWSDIYSAALRHLFKFMQGEITDSESGLPHTDHAMWNCQALSYYAKYRLGEDDRPTSKISDTTRKFIEDKIQEGYSNRKYKQGTSSEWTDTYYLEPCEFGDFHYPYQWEGGV